MSESTSPALPPAEQQALFEAMIELLPDHLEYERDGRIVFANSMARRFAGEEVALNIPSSRLEQLTRADGAEGIYQVAEQTWHDGTIRWRRNVTVQEETAAAYAESQARLERLIANIPGVVYQFALYPDGSYTFPYISDVVAETFGMTPDEIYGDPEGFVALIRKPEHQASFKQTLAESAAAVSEWHWVGEVTNARGEELWVEGRARPSSQIQGVIYWDGVLSDITQLRRAEEEEALSLQRRARYQAMVVALAKNSDFNSLDAKVAARAITETVSKTLPVARASIWLYTPDQSGIECFDLYEGIAQEHSDGLVLRAQDYPFYFRALEAERVIAATDAHRHEATHEFSESYLTPLGIGAMLDVPIRIGQRVPGLLCLEHVGGPRHWSADEENFAVSVADMAALVIENAERRRAERERSELQEKVIELQTAALAELSTPLIPLNDDTLLMPLIGAIDTQRAQHVIEVLLEGVSGQGASIAIIDLTGVPVVDTQVASALIRTAQAVRLLGSQVILTGIRAELAQTIVSLGVDLGAIQTRSNLQAGIEYALAHQAQRQ